MQRFQPAWWQLYLIAAVVVAVLYLQHQLGLTPLEHRVVLLGIVLAGCGVVERWLVHSEGFLG